MKHLSFFAIAALCSGIGSVHAQGTDTCTAPTIITGTGVFPFDNTTATTGTEGQTEAICLQLGSTAILADVWFTWTAPISGTVVIESCNITTVDTKIALYAGNGCPAPGSSLACNDDNCSVGYQSNLQAAVTAGNSYVIQVGLYPGTFPVATPGTGNIAVNMLIPPSNDECTTPIALAGPGTYAVNNTFATTGTTGQSESACNLLGTTVVVNDTWFTYTPTTNGTVTVTTCGVPNPSANEDSKIGIYGNANCPPSGAIACNDDNCPSSTVSGYETTVSFTATCGTTYMIQLGMYGFSGPNAYYVGDLVITETGGTVCGPTAVPFCDGSAVGTTCLGCGNNGAPGSGCGNSSFASGASLAASGAASVGSDTLVLTASNVTGPGLYFQANGVSGAGTFGDGMLCANIGIIRMGVVFPTGSTSSYPGGTTPAPISTAGAPIVAGDVKHYQCWYRDSVAFCTTATFNLTQGLSITWVP